jgi:hypothetical protein
MTRLSERAIISGPHRLSDAPLFSLGPAGKMINRRTHMTDTSTPPERIWVDAWRGDWSPVSGGTKDTAYVREDLTGWRDIESAPKDGSEVLCFVGPGYVGGVIMLRWEMHDGHWAWNDWDYDTWEPTHWMPLPTPPEAKP